MTNALKIAGPLTPRALRVARSLPLVTAESAADAALAIGDRAFPVEIKCEVRIGAAEAWAVVGRSRERGPADGPTVLALADRTTEEARRILEQNGVAYVDGIGNAHVDLPGLYVHVERPQPSRQTRKGAGSPRLAGKAGMVAQALLLEPDRDWRVIDLAARAEVSLGSAHAVLARLEELSIMAAGGEQRTEARRVGNRTALLDTWAEENRDLGVRRMGAYVLPTREGDIALTVGRILRQENMAYALSGVAAAAMLAPFLTAVPVAGFWIDEAQPLEDVVVMLRAEVVESGANVLLSQAKGNMALAFSEERDDLHLANVFRIYYDARRDPRRGREQAEHFREEVIGW